jgi:hypothetical protein
MSPLHSRRCGCSLRTSPAAGCSMQDRALAADPPCLRPRRERVPSREHSHPLGRELHLPHDVGLRAFPRVFTWRRRLGTGRRDPAERQDRRWRLRLPERHGGLRPRPLPGRRKARSVLRFTRTLANRLRSRQERLRVRSRAPGGRKDPGRRLGDFLGWPPRRSCEVPRGPTIASASLVRSHRSAPSPGYPQSQGCSSASGSGTSGLYLGVRGAPPPHRGPARAKAS